ncbi:MULTISPECIES: FMN-binding protein MioC [Pseudoalteromonas]|uniref:FMN-binding protein MioC n=1 Tax=Pseudoalteromonas rubra TaxID=43658 RepID=A0A5S3UPJ0_9GAMM|nr:MULTISPECIES: FMN-binding protein MioC [Pseudoalteromonas]MCG7563707.1 FMN-binding protein MioC [Pseudoalteromonas sp. McH1-42]MEC4090326.1 FMN-binding protein MioC [Pseudoalteromonas rubra]QPB85048.1 FMN-binding protein MioC [Pseudoalteromonas rubra]
MRNIEIIIGSQMGSAEYVAEQLAEQLDASEFNTQLHEQPDLSACQHSLWLVVTSTYGAGDYPDNLLPFIEQLTDHEDLSHVQFAVVGIGDSSYDTFNLAASNCAQLLSDKGAQQLLPVLKIDVQDEALPEDAAIAWLPTLKQQLDQAS